MDIALQIMVNEPTHIIPQPSKNNRRLRNFDITQIYLATDLATKTGSTYNHNDVISSPRTAFIFCTGIPEIITFDQVKYALEQNRTELLNLKEYVESRRLYRFDQAAFNPQELANLAADKQITISWARAKNLILNKRTAGYITDGELV